MKKDTIIVQCDARGCGWQLNEKVDNAKRWHNAACPDCGHKPVISDDDLALLKGLLSLRDMGLAYIGGKKKPDAPHLDIKWDSSGLRNKEGK